MSKAGRPDAGRGVVLDASALLALLDGEPGQEVVAPLLSGAIIGSMNLAEVVGKLAERGMPEAETREALEGLALEVHSVDEEFAYATGVLRLANREHGLSLGDCACLALAAKLGLPAYTADRVWAELDLDVEVRLIRE
ncbi:type II toxin-antitoxin system VapC family toxin [Rubrobacter aplysinae]|uniref:type II toxin-antitoxin system VapC family toxin n=1 Tax=Rubrobacter aplysinae TaxID=909625 RepID=UPI0019109261|nr:type II toxin-antitoxin system VapC family toxin [Rubrobacter aplysinae]